MERTWILYGMDSIPEPARHVVLARVLINSGFLISPNAT